MASDSDKRAEMKARSGKTDLPQVCIIFICHFLFFISDFHLYFFVFLFVIFMCFCSLVLIYFCIDSHRWCVSWGKTHFTLLIFIYTSLIPHPFILFINTINCLSNTNLLNQLFTSLTLPLQTYDDVLELEEIGELNAKLGL